MNDKLQAQIDELSVNQLAGFSTVFAILLGALVSYSGFRLGLTRGELIFGGAVFGLTVLTAIIFTILRALIFSAKETDETPVTAVTHPTFVSLFLFLTLATGVVIGVYFRYAA